MGRIQGTRITAVVVYIYPQRTRLEPIARTTDLEVIIEMSEIWAEAPGSKG